MEGVIPGLYTTQPQPLSFAPSIVVRSFLLARNDGNLLIYSAGTLQEEQESLAEKGGVSRQYLNHRHEASPCCDWVRATFNARLHCHEQERAEVSKSCNVDETFSKRHVVGGDFEVIPTPGHTSGTTVYLWDSGRHRCLFTGDTAFLQGKSEWVTAVLDSSDRHAYIESLEVIRDLDFDVLVPWAADIGEDFYEMTNRDGTRRRIDGILERLRRGERS